MSKIYSIGTENSLGLVYFYTQSLSQQWRDSILLAARLKIHLQIRLKLRSAPVNRPSQAKANKLQTLCSFLPTIVLRKLSRLTRQEASVMRPTREDFHGCAVVMLDMCVPLSTT